MNRWYITGKKQNEKNIITYNNNNVSVITVM